MMESILGSFILWFVVLSIALLFQGSIFIMERASCSVQAGTLAEAAIDSLRAKGFKGLTLGTVTLADKTVDGTLYQTAVEVFVLPDEPVLSQNNLRGIRSTVRWTLRGRDMTMVRESWMSCVKS
ncbi:MAG: hypothetical protein J0I12_17555 [Candidatus Eremiobacteraeota bacterium]|nr:hypothetical protein [Candidatus Eremiobacteraeota bacterium]